MSLSSRVREKKHDQKNNIDTDDSLQMPELKREVSRMPSTPDEDPDLTHCLFITDFELTTDIKEQLNEWTGIKVFNRETFTNLTCQNLLERDVVHIWADISNRHCKSWVEQCLKPNTCYTTVLLHKGTRQNKFVSELTGIVDITCKLSMLNKLHALSFSDLLHKMHQQTKITSPASCLEQLLKIGSKLIKKNEQQK